MAEHPGERLRTRFMEPLGLTASALARSLGVHRSTVSRLLAGSQSLTPELAVRLGQLFQVPPRWWLEMQMEYDVATLQAGDSVPVVKPLSLPPSALLTPNGVLDLSRTTERASREHSLDGVREVRFENGALALLGSD